MFNKRLILFSVLFATARAANDWSVPCTSGTCSYDAGDGVDTAWTSITLNGAATALSDVTTAAGWQISGCKSTWETGVANVVITCVGTPDQMAQCSHLFEGSNAVSKIVRLPQDCGVGPFARVASISELQRREEGGSESHAVVLDYNFDQITDLGQGEVSFEATASNIKGGAVSASALPNVRARGRRRLYPVAPRFDTSQTLNLPPIHLKQNFPLFNQSLDCPAVIGGVTASAAVEVDVDVDVDAQVSFGFAVAGAILPPKLTKFQLTGMLHGAAGADFNINSQLHGSFDSGAIPIFQVGLPGLNFPGILNVGPQFKVNAQLTADLGLETDIKAGIQWNFPSVQLVFPPDQGSSSAQAHPMHRPLSLSLASNVTTEGNLTGHLIPRIEVGVSVLSLANANIFLDLDTSATLAFNAQAALAASTNSGPSTSASGCARLDAAVDVRAGATGQIPPIFDKEVSFDIFSKTFNLFHTCFGTPTKRSVAPAKRRAATAFAKRDLLCPSLVKA